MAGSLTLQRYENNFQKGLAFLEETFKKSKDPYEKFKIVNVRQIYWLNIESRTFAIMVLALKE